MRIKNALALTGLVTACALTFAPSAPQAQQAKDDAAKFTEREIKAYAVTALDIMDIRKDKALEIRTAENPQELAEVRQNMREKMLAAVADNSLITLTDYQNIQRATQDSPDFAARILVAMQSIPDAAEIE